MNPLWTHARSIVVNAYKAKMIYHIPLPFQEERLRTVRTIEAIVKNGELIITATTKDESEDVACRRRPRADYP